MAYVKAEVDQIPHNWVVCQMSECVDVLDSQRIPVNHTERLKRKGNIPYYGATGQVGWIDGYLFDEELLLLGEDGAPFFDKTKSIAYIISGKSWVNNHAHVLRTIIELTSNTFLKHYLNQFDFAGYVSGTTRLKLNQRSMKTIPVLVPPLNEQRRIVAKLEKLLQKVDACKERLDKIPTILKRFRQSILAAACSGKLTSDWREKDEMIENDELPADWQWTEIEKLLPKKGGIFDGPFGSNLKTADYTDSGVRVIRLENIGHLRFTDKKESYISNGKYQTLTKHTVGEGDIIFASFITDETRVCILPFLKTKAIAKADCFCLRPKEDMINRVVHTKQCRFGNTALSCFVNA